MATRFARRSDAAAMQVFARERGVFLHNAEAITKLWQVGLIRADVISSERGREPVHGLEFVADEGDRVAFFDGRQIRRFESGCGAILADLPQLTGVEPLFHPHRLYVLHHVQRVFRSMASVTQFLQKPEGLINIAKIEVDHLERWTRTTECAERFEYWNRCCELSTLAEVVAHGRVYGYGRRPTNIAPETIDVQRSKYRDELLRFLRDSPLEELEQVRDDLVISAEMLDDNKILHVLLRLAAVEQRERLHNDIGAAMQFLAMAECIRRATEAACDRHLREEDELGFGQWLSGARKTIYGSERVLDSSPADRRDFMSSMGLDVGPKVRCYVEGDTELAALTSAVGDGGGVTFINMRGQFAEARGRGLAFAESLAADQTARLFSIIALDGDRSDNVRVVRKAAEEQRMFGAFYIASPDFEFENFTLFELVTVAIELRREEGALELPGQQELLARVSGVRSGKEFVSALANTACEGIDKGARWGTALMKHALNHEQLPAGHKNEGKVRQVIEMARMIVRGRQSGYLRSLEGSRTDPITGEVVPRAK